MKRALAVVAVFFIVFYASFGCTPSVHLFLYNHSESELRLNDAGGEEVLRSEATREVRLSSSLRLYRGDELLEYRIPKIPMEFWRYTTDGFYEVRLQIEPSAQIYLLGTAEMVPLKDLTNQPTGFPMIPSAGSN